MSWFSLPTLGVVFLVFIFLKTYRLFRSIFYVHLLAKRLNHCVNLSTYGKWAVVTGSTDGIGKGYAKELARRGLNILLISRNQEKLETTAQEIREHFSNNIEVRVLAFDFGQSTLQSYEIIKKAVNDLEIGILVNNVGIASDFPDYFLSYSGGDKMTYLILPQMLQRRRGIVINISSATAFFPAPLNTVYASTKSFLAFFTKGLMWEYANSGVTFQCVYPYFVATKLVNIKRATVFAPDPNYFANCALNTVGLESETVGCLSHALQNLIVQLIPESWSSYVAKAGCLHEREKHIAKLAKNQ